MRMLACCGRRRGWPAARVLEHLNQARRWYSNRPAESRMRPKPHMRLLVHPRPHPGTTRGATPRPTAAAPTYEPELLAGPLHPTPPSRPPHQAHLNRLRRPPPSPNRVRMLSKRFTSSTKPTTGTGPTRPSDGSPTSTPPDRHREYHEVVDTIISWRDQILACHTKRRATTGSI